MKKTCQRALSALLVILSLLLAASGCGGAKTFMLAVKSISKHGNVILDVTFEDMKAKGIEVGDIVTVSVGGAEYDLPVGTAFTDVDSGSMVCRLDLEDDEVALAINMGSFAAVTGVGEKQTVEEDPGYRWDVKMTGIGFTLKEKKGYLDEYNARNLTRTDVREDYASLSDEEFANFREVAVRGLKEKTLYRSSTPLEPSIGRNGYAMAATEKAGIRSIINLDDSAELMKSYDTYAGSYYSGCKIINPEMNYDFGSGEFAEKVKESVLFITDNEGPYLIHCKEGKDRTGILCAILECFVGATADDVEKDYMITFFNYYNVKPEDAAYGIILKNNLFKMLCELFKTDDIKTADLKERAREYLLSIGLTEAQLASLGEKLGK